MSWARGSRGSEFSRLSILIAINTIDLCSHCVDVIEIFADILLLVTLEDDVWVHVWLGKNNGYGRVSNA